MSMDTKWGRGAPVSGCAVGGNSAVCDAPPRGGLTGALDATLTTVRELQAAVSRLHAKLEPMLSAEPKGDLCGAIAPHVCGAESMISQVGDAIAETRSVVESILSRLWL